MIFCVRILMAYQRERGRERSGSIQQDYLECWQQTLKAPQTMPLEVMIDQPVRCAKEAIPNHHKCSGNWPTEVMVAACSSGLSFLIYTITPNRCSCALNTTHGHLCQYRDEEGRWEMRGQAVEGPCRCFNIQNILKILKMKSICMIALALHQSRCEVHLRMGSHCARVASQPEGMAVYCGRRRG
jgi:hypothetical protein